ncbi:MAG: glycosyltransferase [Actinobacteria bacterium]|nr:MAG: glycosyltransferase [Actinomycetota bacterium]
MGRSARQGQRPAQSGAPDPALARPGRAAARIRHERCDARVRRTTDGAEVARTRTRGRRSFRRCRARAPLERRAQALGIGDRVRFLGAQPRERIVELFRAADATILSSSWENFPHTVVEALAVGTPVLAMEAGGVAEVVHDGVNGLLVAPGDTAALSDAVRRYFREDGLREQLRAGAAGSVADYAPERVFGELEATLMRVAGS